MIRKTESVHVFRCGSYYHLLKAKTLKSIDSFDLHETEEKGKKNLEVWLFLFIATVSEMHPVNTADIVQTIKKLDIIDNLREVALVFAAPR
ncbi:hypothetical protein PHMEG_00040188 [Phytophthora megakarya]|uniref:Uncharacterized protein n=1 Tax=Phytophthora megakarya TaxID=4795 RepID=A0A225UEA9_9STRA|nr:hypothetical protein PHMEG_00040188 [Phytophthora megakarya]